MFFMNLGTIGLNFKDIEFSTLIAKHKSISTYVGFNDCITFGRNILKVFNRAEKFDLIKCSQFSLSLAPESG
jgi:hypothetical protein